MSLKIPIKGEKDLYLEGDNRQFMLRKYGKPTTNAKGELVDSVIDTKYYSNLEHVFNALLKRSVLQSEAKTFKQLLDEVKFFREEIRMELKGV